MTAEQRRPHEFTFHACPECAAVVAVEHDGKIMDNREAHKGWHAWLMECFTALGADFDD